MEMSELYSMLLKKARSENIGLTCVVKKADMKESDMSIELLLQDYQENQRKSEFDREKANLIQQLMIRKDVIRMEKRKTGWNKSRLFFTWSVCDTPFSIYLVLFFLFCVGLLSFYPKKLLLGDFLINIGFILLLMGGFSYLVIYYLNSKAHVESADRYIKNLEKIDHMLDVCLSDLKDSWLDTSILKKIDHLEVLDKTVYYRHYRFSHLLAVYGISTRYPFRNNIECQVIKEPVKQPWIFNDIPDKKEKEQEDC